MSHQSDLISQDILAYLKQHENKELLRFLTCGNVDDGKSTLIGRLLHDSKMIYEDHLEAIKKDSVKSGTTGEGEIDLALLVDGLQAEREQGITIDVAYRYFSTEKRKFIIADTPGHEQYTRNMATGASTCELAIILVDARYGVQTQTKRHSFIASLLGIKHIIVAINKMDLVAFSEARFEEIKADYLAFSKNLTIPNIHFVPMSALKGDNVVNQSESTPWYQGQTLMSLLNTVEVSANRNFDDFRLPVQYVNRPNLDFRGFAGTIASGIVKPGDNITVLPSGKTSKIASIVTQDGNLDEAFVGQAVTLTLENEIDVSRGDMIVHTHNQPEVCDTLNAHIVWMGEHALHTGQPYYIKHATLNTTGVFSQIHHKIDVNTLETSEGHTEVGLNEIAMCELHVNQPLAFDPYEKSKGTGSFIIIDRLTNVTVGAGMIIGKASNTGTSNLSDRVSFAEREKRLGQKGAIINLTGTDSTKLAIALERVLFTKGRSVFALTDELNTVNNAEILKKAGTLVITTEQSAQDFDFSTSDVSLDAQVESIYTQLKATLLFS